MKTVDVYIDSGFTIQIPDEIDITNPTSEQQELINSLCREKVVEMLQDKGRYIDFALENCEELDTNNNERTDEPCQE